MSGTTLPLTLRALPGDCAIAYANAWVTADRAAVVARCGSALAALPVDGSPSHVITTFGTGPLNMDFDGHTLVYLENRTLFGVSISGGTPAVLSLNVSYTSFPAKLSGDGKTVVFVADSSEGPSRLLQAVDPLGGEPKTLQTAPATIRFFAISPDSTRVLTGGVGSALLSLPIAGGDGITLGSDLLSQDLVFSPDGKSVAFWAKDSQWTVGVSRVDGVSTFFGGGDMDVFILGTMAFTPDGTRVIVQWTDSSLQDRIGSVPTTGGNSVLVVADQAEFLGLVGSQATAVLFTSQLGALSPDLSIVDLGGGSTTKLSTLDCMNVRLAVSPDRKRAVYTDARTDLVMADLDARTVTTLVAGAVAGEQSCIGIPPVWSPDGTKIAYRHCPAGKSDCVARVISLDGTTLIEAGAATKDNQSYFSPDSRHLIGMEALFTFEATGVTTRPLTADFPLIGGSNSPRNFRPSTFPWIDNRNFVVGVAYGVSPPQTKIGEVGD